MLIHSTLQCPQAHSKSLLFIHFQIGPDWTRCNISNNNVITQQYRIFFLIAFCLRKTHIFAFLQLLLCPISSFKWIMGQRAIKGCNGDDTKSVRGCTLSMYHVLVLTCHYITIDSRCSLTHIQNACFFFLSLCNLIYRYFSVSEFRFRLCLLRYSTKTS